MSTPPDEIRDLDDMFAYDLAAVYDMETKLADALDELSRTATNDTLSKGFAIHRTETETQVRRVEAVFEALEMEPIRRDDRVIDGLLEETAQFEVRAENDDLRNLRYLTAAIETERIEITNYEGLLRTANEAGFGDDVTKPLEDTLEEEKKTLRKLEGLAEKPGLETLWKALTGS